MAYRPDYESADYQEGYADGKAESVKEWQGLSDGEIGVLFDSVMANDTESTEFFGIEYARAIEQALKEKNS